MHVHITHHDNAFNLFELGLNPYGIFFCAVPGIMHALAYSTVFFSCWLWSLS